MNYLVAINLSSDNLQGSNIRDASQKSITGDACCFLTIR